jgi:hypothetical protein
MVFPALSCLAQSAENITATFKDGIATITYDLVSPKTNELYRVDLYASYNEFNAPLALVSGDVGRNLKAVKGKKREWKAFQESGSSKDDITFKIKIVLMFQPLEFINPTGGAIRRGHTTIIEWQGGYINNEKELELYHWEKKIASLGKVKGVWQYTWTIPKDLEKGDGYSLKLTGGDESLVSNTFRVKPRTPLLLKLSPVFAAAAIIPFLGGSGGPSKGNELPAAPNPE